jgi:acyl-CoA reductase-like NAD-dependent aldehyde dehydrogenase
MEANPLVIGGRRVTTDAHVDVFAKANGELIGRACLAGPVELEAAIAAAVKAAPAMADLAACDRERSLQSICTQLRTREDEFARLLCREVGKPIRDARGEVARMIDTFHTAAGEAVRQEGAVLALDALPRGRGLTGFVRRFPVGACAFITPFNFPLNLAAHKIAPAIAAGCSFVLKPASLTPLTTLLLADVLAHAGLPQGAVSIVPAERAAADVLVTDERLKLLSFTGSPSVGWDMKARAGKKKVVLELGGNAACIVEPDWDAADACARIVAGAFGNSGQSCIKTQRVLVHESRYADLSARLIAATRSLQIGDPEDERTQVGPLITERDAMRLEAWIAAAVRGGARVLCGGKRRGPLLEPTLLENVPSCAEIRCEEAFGPVTVLESYTHFEDALRSVNDSRYGLQAGLFTRDWVLVEQAYKTLEVGGVIVGDVPTFRVDHMPYGGVKDSGSGREGVRWAMEDMTEPRLLVQRTPPC